MGGFTLDNSIDSSSIPAVLYKVTEQRIIPNKKACRILKDNLSIEKNLKNILRYSSKKEFTEYLKNIYIIGENENLISVYFLPFDKLDGYEIAILQDISMSLIETIKTKSDNVMNLVEDDNEDIIVTDGEGVILNISNFFEKFYDIKKQDLLGRNVFELEKLRVFYPSAAVKVLRTKQKITMLQKNKLNNEILVTAIPIKDANGCIVKVVCFSYYVQTFVEIKKQFEVLERNGKVYTKKLRHLVDKGINPNLMMGKNKEMKKIFNLITKVADFDVNFLITGETGVGKSYFAKLIHSLSKRSKRQFIELNCGAIPEHLLESELFGYEGGAFTGARKEGKLGLIELSDNGTLFLDEIGDLPLNLQVKLLKVIQDKTFNRIGGTKIIKVNFRLITATNQDLRKLIKEKKFREDLFYRLNVVSINIPPLRERKEDIPDMISYFVRKINEKYGLNKSFNPEAVDMLINCKWPGNIRELENTIERILLLSDDDIINKRFLEDNVKNKYEKDSNTKNVSLKEQLNNYEGKLILKALEKYKTTVKVGQVLGISQATAARKIKKYTHSYS
ncbi:Sigma-54 dependent transcriptional regulator [Clostridiaceae bacterium BL-3]|nr:AAA domain-containing protein [Clostridium sp. HV4-5-A1G]CAB1262095.1 Sigma-54 dependent transcriptional regulator [Clostridiaceae bacterium BL-3]